MNKKIVPVIMAGGKGTRLWPLSRATAAKQFIRFIGDRTLFQGTLDRVGNADIYEPALVITNEEFRFLVAEQAREMDTKLSGIVLEPEARDTAAAVAVAALMVSELFGGDTLDAPELYQIAGDKVDGVIFTTFYDAAQPATELTSQFLDAYRAKYGKEPSATNVMCFDAYLTLRAAIETAGSTDPAAIRDAIFATKGFVGAAGTITLDESHNAVRPVVFKKVKGDGTSEFVKMIEP